MTRRPTEFASSTFSVKVNRWPFLDGRRVTRGLGEEAVRLIRERLAQGRQESGQPLPPYSDTYRTELRRANEGTRRDMQLSGSLLKALTVLQVRRNSVSVGWPRTTRSPNVIRQKGGTKIGRGRGQTHRAIVRRLTQGDANTRPRGILGLTKGDRAKLARWLRTKKRLILRVR